MCRRAAAAGDKIQNTGFLRAAVGNRSPSPLASEHSDSGRRLGRSVRAGPVWMSQPAHRPLLASQMLNSADILPVNFPLWKKLRRRALFLESIRETVAVVIAGERAG